MLLVNLRLPFFHGAHPCVQLIFSENLKKTIKINTETTYISAWMFASTVLLERAVGMQNMSDTRRNQLAHGNSLWHLYVGENV